MSPQRVIGIDLGGTKALAGVVEADGNVLSRVIVSSRELRDRPADLLDRLADVARSAATEAKVDFDDIRAVGIGIPGTLDLTRSIVGVAPNLDWINLPARAELEKRMPGKQVFLENDVRAAALGEHYFGAGRGHRSMVALFVGTGVGGGIILDHRVYHGARGGAGEIGHVVVAAGGPECGCGQAGCVEAMAARGAVARYVQEMVDAGRTTVLSEALKGNLASLTSRDLRLALERGDEVALDAAKKSAWYTGIAVGGLVNTVDPDLVVLGGGIAEAPGDAYVEWVRAAARPQILALSAKDIAIVPSVLGDDAGLLGAALSALGGLGESSPSATFTPA